MSARSSAEREHDYHHDPAQPEREWGYWGTIGRIENDPAADPAKAWDIASCRIAEATTASPEGVRDFLNSRHGRHFADDVAERALEGRDAEGRHRHRDHSLDGVAHRPQDQPRDRDPARASLPHRPRQSLRDHGRASLLTRLRRVPEVRGLGADPRAVRRRRLLRRHAGAPGLETASRRHRGGADRRRRGLQDRPAVALADGLLEARRGVRPERGHLRHLVRSARRRSATWPTGRSCSRWRIRRPR